MTSSRRTGGWDYRDSEPVDYPDDQAKEISRLEDALATQLASKPRRLAHSLSVAREAEHLARLYGVDEFEARVAGTLHDWSKALPKREILARSARLGIDLGVDLELVEPLLHGMVAARELPGIFPDLSKGVLQAIDRHTLGASDMSDLDMVVFVADGIEPLRPDSPGIVATRELVGEVSLEDLFWNSFVGGMRYVLETERYLYPGTLQIYNDIALRRSAARN